MPSEGFGAELLSHQDADGQWAGGPFFPAGFRGEGPQPWTATTWVLKDLREHGVNMLTLGQYLQPSRHHLPVQRYVSPDEFEEMKKLGALAVITKPFDPEKLADQIRKILQNASKSSSS